jgi:hypothetical protein
VLDGLRGEHSIAELCRREGIAESLYELCWIFGDGVNHAADFSSLATSMPSRNVTPLTTFGN